MFNSLLAATLFSLSSLGGNLVLQTDQELVNRLNWGVYYDDTTLTCTVASEQNNFAVFLSRGVDAKHDTFSFGTPAWKFTMNDTKEFVSTVTYSDNGHASVRLPFNFKAGSPYVSVDFATLSFLEDSPTEFSVQFSAKFVVAFDIVGMAALQGEYMQCIEQMKEINEEIISDMEEEQEIKEHSQ